MSKTLAAARGKPGRPPAKRDAGPKSARGIRRLTDLFKTLADEHRLKILFLLTEHGELSVSALGGELGQSQPAVSHHLTQLKAAGLVDYRRDGKFNYYALNPAGLHPLFDVLFPGDAPAKLSLCGLDLALKRR